METWLKFTEYMMIKESSDMLEQPSVIKADPPLKMPYGLRKIVDAFKESKSVPISKEIDPKTGGIKPVTMRTKKIYLAGESVLSYLLRHTLKKYDLVTDALPSEVERIVSGKPSIRVAEKTKNKITLVSDNEKYTIETMSRDEKNGDDDPGFTANTHEDVHRREFTVEGMYYDLVGDKIIDHVGGLRDVKDKTLRFIKKDKKKSELTKYKYAYLSNIMDGSNPDKDTHSQINGIEIEDLSLEEARDLFWEGLNDLHTSATKFIKSYNELGLLKTAFPGLELRGELPECQSCKTKPIVLAYLLQDNPIPKIIQKLREFGYSNKEVTDTVFLINLRALNEEHLDMFKREMMKTSLNKRQLLDWANINNLGKEMIQKLVDHRLG